MKPDNSRILAIKAGSSSIRFALYKTREVLQRGLYGKVDRIGLSGTNLTFYDPATNRRDSRKLAVSDHKSAASFLLDWLEQQKSLESVKAVGHRVVHPSSNTSDPKPHTCSRSVPENFPRMAVFAGTRRLSTLHDQSGHASVELALTEPK